MSVFSLLTEFLQLDNENRRLKHIVAEQRLDIHTASRLRDQGKGRTVTFSPKVFIPLTQLCRDFCSY